MAPSVVKLLGFRESPYVSRVQIALNMKSIGYEIIQENLLNKSEFLLRSNPVYKKVPVLIHAEKPICESLVIVQYIDENWPGGRSILPSDPYDRAISRFWAAYIDQWLYPLLWALAKAEGEEAKTATMEKVYEGWIFLEEAFANCSKGKSFFGGDNIGYVDIALGSFLGWLRAFEIMYNVKILDETKAPSLVKWAERFVLDEAVRDVIPEPKEIVEFFQMIQAARAKAAA